MVENQKNEGGEQGGGGKVPSYKVDVRIIILGGFAIVALALALLSHC